MRSDGSSLSGEAQTDGGLPGVIFQTCQEGFPGARLHGRACSSGPTLKQPAHPAQTHAHTHRSSSVPPCFRPIGLRCRSTMSVCRAIIRSTKCFTSFSWRQSHAEASRIGQGLLGHWALRGVLRPHHRPSAAQLEGTRTWSLQLGSGPATRQLCGPGAGHPGPKLLSPPPQTRARCDGAGEDLAWPRGGDQPGHASLS